MQIPGGVLEAPGGVLLIPGGVLEDPRTGPPPTRFSRARGGAEGTEGRRNSIRKREEEHQKEKEGRRKSIRKGEGGGLL